MNFSFPRGHVPSGRGSSGRTARALLAGALAAVLSLGACGGSDEVVVDRGPTTLPVQAKLDGLYWDAEASRLYFGDDAANAVGVWDDARGFGKAIELPALQAEQRATLGQLVRGGDGVLYVTRFGFSEYGTLVAVPSTGAAYNVDGLDPSRRRIGVASTGKGTLIDGWFTQGGGVSGTGSVSEVTLQGRQATERELVTGLDKPVGVAVAGDALFVSDQSSGALLRYSLVAVRAQPATAADGELLVTFGADDDIDLMTAAADGTLYFGGGGGTLFRVDASGAVARLVTGWPGIRGVALDERNQRLFAAVAAADEQALPSIRILPLD